MHAAITSYIDVAQITLYLFWGLLAGVIYYLHQEDKREGYPLVIDSPRGGTTEGFPSVPSPKTFLLADGTIVQKPDARSGDNRPVKATPAEVWPGAPLVPDGDPMRDGVGPAAYAERLDIPDATFHGTPKLVPLRIASHDGFHLDHNDPDPRGMPVLGLDGVQGATVRDVWVDRAEYIVRYFEIELAGDAGARRALLPTTLTRISSEKQAVLVRSITAAQFAHVPAHKSPDQVTRLEEDKICAYYSSGHLYATPERSEPLI